MVGGPPSPHDDARLWMMQQVAHMFFAVMMLHVVRAQRPALRLTAADFAGPPLAELRREQGALMRTLDGRLRYAITVFSELDANLASPRFAAALRQI